MVALKSLNRLSWHFNRHGVQYLSRSPRFLLDTESKIYLGHEFIFPAMAALKCLNRLSWHSNRHNVMLWLHGLISSSTHVTTERCDCWALFKLSWYHEYSVNVLLTGNRFNLALPNSLWYCQTKVWTPVWIAKLKFGLRFGLITALNKPA